MRGGSSHQKPSHPVGAGALTRPTALPTTTPRRRGYQRTWYSIPPPQRQWRKRDHGSFKRRPPEIRGILQRILPEGHHNSTTPTSGCTVARDHFHRSIFSFSESRTAFFFCGAKEKAVLAPAGQAKNNCKIKHPSFPQKKRRFYPRGVPPPIRRRSTHRVRAVSKRHSRQETACRQRLGCGPSWASGKTIPVRAAKNNCKIKRTAFPQKKRRFYPQGLRPVCKATQPSTAGLWVLPEGFHLMIKTVQNNKTSLGVGPFFAGPKNGPHVHAP